MTARGIASVGECMLELSGADAGLAGAWALPATRFNTLWALRALTVLDAPPTMSRPSATTRSRATRSPSFREHGIGIGVEPAHPRRAARPLRHHADRRRTLLHLLALAMRRRGSLPTIRPHWRKALKTGRLSIFPESLWQFSTPAARTTLAGRRCGRARRNGCLIAFDPNYRPRLWPDAEAARAAIAEALEVTDIALPTFPDEQTLFGDARPQATAGTAGTRRRGGDRRQERRSSRR